MQTKPIRSALISMFALPAIAVWCALGSQGVAAEIVTDVAPPPLRAERVAAREGYVWAPGYWQWSGSAYRWVDGSYIFERRGAHWVPDHWEQDGAHWHYLHGHWEH
jgi:hypothetical protein